MCAQIYFLDGYSCGSAAELLSLGHPTPNAIETDNAPGLNDCLCSWGVTGVRRYLDRAFPSRRFAMSAMGDWDEL